MPRRRRINKQAGAAQGVKPKFRRIDLSWTVAVAPIPREEPGWRARLDIRRYWAAPRRWEVLHPDPRACGHCQESASLSITKPTLDRLPWLPCLFMGVPIVPLAWSTTFPQPGLPQG